MVQDARSRALRSLSSFLVAEASLAETLLQITDIVTDAIPGAAYAGMTLLDEGAVPTTAVFNDRTSPDIDGAQYRSGQGPCLDAWRTQATVLIDDMAQALDRYPEFAALAMANEVHSTLSVSLGGPGASMGALNLYAHQAHTFSEQDASLAEELGSVAGTLVANSQAYWGAFSLTEQLHAALDSRAVIEQAKGILMAQTDGLGPDGAFELLKSASQRENVKLRDIAARIVTRRNDP